MDLSDAFELFLILGSVLISARLLAPYVAGVYTNSRSRLERVFAPLEKLMFRALGVDALRVMGWKEYFLSAVMANAFGMALAFVILIFQDFLPLNPQGFHGLSLGLAFQTVVSFGTNTNLQHYNGESRLSYLSQMGAIQFLQFSSAATGICFGVAIVRGFITGSKGLGNFYSDFVRTITRILLPLSLLSSVALVWLGVPQTISGYASVIGIEGIRQTVPVGPVASLVSIMQIGTNGGGYYGANSAYPLQNPNPATDVLELYLMLLLPTCLIFAFGRFLGKKREARPLLISAYSLYAFNLLVAFLAPLPSAQAPGIEVRFGGFLSTFWTVTTTSTMTGSVNASLYAMNPLAILSAFMGMFVQAAPGGVGSGLAYMLMYVLITVFVVGLMSGRTPEYLGLKIGARDLKLLMLAFLIHPLIILVPTILAYVSGAAAAVNAGSGPLGLTAIMYEFASAASNNGSDFLGAAANTQFFNLSTAFVMLIGRYAPLGLLMALSGSMIGRKRFFTTGLDTASFAFSGVLVLSVLVLVVLTFLPFLALGPILSYLRGMVNGFG